MNPLDVQRINCVSPYRVTESIEENFFEFFTDYDVHYSVGFMPDENSLMQSEAYHLIIVNVDN